MKWLLKAAGYGDIVRVKLGNIYHYGIFVNDEDVVQFGLPPTAPRQDSDVAVLSTDVNVFLSGGILEVGVPERKERKLRKSPDETVKTARSGIGEKGYNILYNNCEHFANECAFGKKFCTQTDDVRNMCRELCPAEIYVAKIPFRTDNDKILPKERKKLIDDTANVQLKKQRYYVWKLLERALDESFSLKASKMKFEKRNGRWLSDGVYFSLSHSENVVAVAVCKTPVGIDVEKLGPERFTDLHAEKILTTSELERYNNLKDAKGEYLNEIWTKKEATFKASEAEVFKPSQTEIDEKSVKTVSVNAEGCDYLVSVCCRNPETAKFNYIFAD